MASNIIRSGKTPLGNLIHRHLCPTIITIASATNLSETETFYNRNYLFPPTFGPRVELPNQAVPKSANGNQFGFWAFSDMDHQYRVQAHCSPKKKDPDSDSDSDDQEYDDGNLSNTDWDEDDDGADTDYDSDLVDGSDDE